MALGPSKQLAAKHGATGGKIIVEFRPECELDENFVLPKQQI
jgi:hypothetical protein